MKELETRLYNNAKTVKSYMTAPFDIESEELCMSKKNFNIKTIVLIAAAVCVIGTTVFAAINLLSARDVASSLGNTKLAEYFAEQETISETVTDGDYKATVLGVTSGENLSDFESSSWEVFPERTYAVVAVEKTDGSAMTFDDEILVTPLIEGLKPWQYNVFTMNGGYTADIIDGVLYRIVECDSIADFADRKVYMAVLSNAFIDNRPYAFDEETGEITVNEEYDGTNILIELELDKAAANPEKAEEYMKKHDEAIKVEISDDSEDVYIIGEDPEFEAN